MLTSRPVSDYVKTIAYVIAILAILFAIALLVGGPGYGCHEGPGWRCD